MFGAIDYDKAATNMRRTTIKSIRLQGFKSFDDTGDVALAPLTIIFGRNNVGKSSLLQSLLLLRQTIDSPDAEGRLTLSGNLFDGGAYADLVHMHKASRNIRFSFHVERHGLDYLIENEYSSDEPRPPRLAAQKISLHGKELVSVKRGKGQGGPYQLFVLGKRQKLARGNVINYSLSARSLSLGLASPILRRSNIKSDRANDALFRAILALREFEIFLRQMRAIGPFRQHPLRRYEYSGLARTNVEIHGSNVIDALIHDSLRRGKLQGELVSAVNQWLAVVGHVRLMPVRRISHSAKLYELRVRDRDSGRWANISDIGSGIAQALPVLVEGLRTEKGGLYIVQEPEIHLHPDAQLGMADFLIGLAAKDRMVMVETHSENFLLRLRRRLLDKRSGIKKEDVKILVVDKARKGSSTVTPVSLDDLAQLIHWPAGFMEEATRERIELMKAMGKNIATKRRRQRKK